MEENNVDVHDPKYRFEDRVQNMIKKGRTREEAEQIVTTVILTKEQA